MVNPVTFLAVLVIDHRVAEIINVATCFPRGWVHKDGSINAYNIFMHLRHALPPVIADIFFQLAAIGAIIVYCTQSIIDLTGGKYKAIFFGMGNYSLKTVFLLCTHKWAAN